MALTRRDFLHWLGAGSLSVYLAGCAQDKQVLNGRPGPDWPTMVQRPTPQSQVPPVSSSPQRMPTDFHAPASRPGSAPRPSVPATEEEPSVVSLGSLQPIPRAKWAKARPNPNKIQPMAGITMITVHHEGWTPVTFTDAVSTAARLESIRKSHLERLGAGDIGYHFIIDRAGRLWQGRDLRYQGAHVREHNPHNIGLMCLGNFDVQRPTDAQYATLQKTLAALMKQYKVPLRQVYTHQELNKTECPGSVLQAHMRSLRRSGIV